MSEMAEVTAQYIDAVKQTETYKRFQDAKEAVHAVDGLQERLDEYRKRMFELQSLLSSNELFERMDALQNEYEDFCEDPVVSEFLEAELALCRMMQESSLQIVKEIQFEL